MTDALTNHEKSRCPACRQVYRLEPEATLFYCAPCREMWTTLSVPYDKQAVIIDDDLVSRLAYQMAWEFVRGSLGTPDVNDGVREMMLKAGAAACADRYKPTAKYLLLPPTFSDLEKIPEDPDPDLPG